MVRLESTNDFIQWNRFIQAQTHTHFYLSIRKGAWILCVCRFFRLFVCIVVWCVIILRLCWDTKANGSNRKTFKRWCWRWRCDYCNFVSAVMQLLRPYHLLCSYARRVQFAYLCYNLFVFFVLFTLCLPFNSTKCSLKTKQKKAKEKKGKRKSLLFTTIHVKSFAKFNAYYSLWV